MKSIKAVFLKQILDTVKNKVVFIQFLMLPVMAAVMENVIEVEGMPEHFFVKLFAVMFVGMAPLTCMAAIISEEKEKNTLRVLMMSNVRPGQYLISTGAYVYLMCMAGTAVFAALGEYRSVSLAAFLCFMTAGILVSELIGAVIGVSAGNQMAATSLTLPVMMLFSFVPMLSTFNETIKKFAGVIYSQQLSNLINGIGTAKVPTEAILVIAANFGIGLAVFVGVYRRKGLG